MSRLGFQGIRVLLLAEACNPRWTSVPLVGYNFARALSRRPDVMVTLVTHVRNRPALEEDPIVADADVHYVDNEFIARPLTQISKRLRGGHSLSWTTDTAMAWPGYMAFEKLVNRRFSARLRGREFDIIHRVTPVSPTMGSPLASLTETPMVIGPLNGGLPWPKEHPGLRHREREWMARSRGCYRFLPYYRSTYRRLAGVIAGSRHTATEIPSDFAGLRFYMPENGLDPERFPIADSWTRPDVRFRFISVGRLVPYKGMDLIVEAMHRSELLRTCELHIIGDGPLRSELEAQSRMRGLDGNVSFVGWTDQRDLASRLRQAQAFVFPSLREFGGGVVLEAMACGLPSIIVDYGGPAELACADCATLIPMANRERLIEGLRRSMETLVRNPDLCQSMGKCARVRVAEQFTWDAKASRLVEIYEQVLAAQCPRALRATDRCGNWP